MAHVLEPASSGRSRCRGCGEPIARGELRFGERLANPFADGEMTVWFHTLCAAYKRPEPLLQALAELASGPPDRERLERAARLGVEHRRVPRIDGAELTRTAQARCRSCREPIERGGWRIRLAYFEEGRFTPGGYVHLRCRQAYFETEDLLERLLHFSPKLDAAERDELARACSAQPAGAGPAGAGAPGA